ncbi:MAG: hypothetical protein ABFD60_11220 [Bryobacteraceae bacterium]
MRKIEFDDGTTREFICLCVLHGYMAIVTPRFTYTGKLSCHFSGCRLPLAKLELEPGNAEKVLTAINRQYALKHQLCQEPFAYEATLLDLLSEYALTQGGINAKSE